MPKDAFLTRLDRENAQFMAQQCLLAGDEYRRFTPADMLRMLFIGARKAYMASGTVMNFCDWWQQKYQQFLANQFSENQANHENHEFPVLLKASGERVATSGTGRSTNIAGRGPLRYSRLSHLPEAKAVWALSPLPFLGKTFTVKGIVA